MRQCVRSPSPNACPTFFGPTETGNCTSWVDNGPLPSTKDVTTLAILVYPVNQKRPISLVKFSTVTTDQCSCRDSGSTGFRRGSLRPRGALELLLVRVPCHTSPVSSLDLGDGSRVGRDSTSLSQRRRSLIPCSWTGGWKIRSLLR